MNNERYKSDRVQCQGTYRANSESKRIARARSAANDFRGHFATTVMVSPPFPTLFVSPVVRNHRLNRSRNVFIIGTTQRGKNFTLCIEHKLLLISG